MLRLARPLTVIGLTLALLVPAASPGSAQAEPSPTPAPATDGQQSDVDKPPPWDVVGRAEHAFNSWISSLVASALDPVLSLVGKTILATPQVDRHPRVRDMWRFSLGVANAALVIFVLVGAGIVMVGGLFLQLTAKELLPRVFVAALAANFAIVITGQLIEIANALTLAILGVASEPSDISVRISEVIFGAGMQNPLFLIFALIVLVIAVLVLVAYVIRIAALIVLLAGGPLFLITHSLPQTDHLARTWWRLLVAMIASPVLQAFVLTATVKVFLSGEGVFGPAGGGLVDLLVLGCLLYLLYRIPLWTINVALRGAGSRAWTAAKQKVVVAVRSAVAP
jgi:hypothetical protein